MGKMARIFRRHPFFRCFVGFEYRPLIQSSALADCGDIKPSSALDFGICYLGDDRGTRLVSSFGVLARKQCGSRCYSARCEAHDRADKMAHKWCSPSWGTETSRMVHIENRTYENSSVSAYVPSYVPRKAHKGRFSKA